VAKVLGLDGDEGLVQEAPAFAAALLRAGVRESKAEIINAQFLKHVDWSGCDKVGLQNIIDAVEVITGAKIVDSLGGSSHEEVEKIRARFIERVASRDDISFEEIRSVAKALDLEEDEVLADEAPALAAALARAGVREGRAEILEAQFAEDIDWPKCDKAGLRTIIDAALEEILAGAAIGQELPWKPLKLIRKTISPIVFPDPLDRVDWLFDCFDEAGGSSEDSDLREMLTESVTAWLLSGGRKKSDVPDESRLRRAKALVDRVETWSDWLELDPMEDARATLCQALGIEDDDE